MRYLPGTKVTEIEIGPWTQFATGMPSKYAPKFGEIYTVESNTVIFGEDFISLSEIRNPYGPEWYLSECFAPVIADAVLEQALKEVPETISI